MIATHGRYWQSKVPQRALYSPQKFRQALKQAMFCQNGGDEIKKRTVPYDSKVHRFILFYQHKDAPLKADQQAY